MWQVEALPFLANKGLDGAEHKVRINKVYLCVCPLVVIETLLPLSRQASLLIFVPWGGHLRDRGGRGGERARSEVVGVGREVEEWYS
jgi:hypothetical protein